MLKNLQQGTSQASMLLVDCWNTKKLNPRTTSYTVDPFFLQLSQLSCKCWQFYNISSAFVGNEWIKKFPPTNTLWSENSLHFLEGILCEKVSFAAICWWKSTYNEVLQLRGSIMFSSPSLRICLCLKI